MRYYKELSTLDLSDCEIGSVEELYDLFVKSKTNAEKIALDSKQLSKLSGKFEVKDDKNFLKGIQVVKITQGEFNKENSNS